MVITLLKKYSEPNDLKFKQFNEIEDTDIITYLNRFGEKVTLNKLQSLPKVIVKNMCDILVIQVMSINNTVLTEYWYPYSDYIKLCR